MLRRTGLILMVSTLIFCGWQAFGNTPPFISYQGFLTDSEGAVSGSYSMIFNIYDQEVDGTPLWSSGTIDVSVDSGYFFYTLGGESGIPAICFDGPNRWLGIQVLPDNEMSPRSRLTSVPYSYSSRHADTASYGLSGGGWSCLGGAVGLATSSDNVGIGIDNPLAKLHISDEGGRALDPFRVDYGGSNYFIVKNTGRVGVGISSPTTQFHVRQPSYASAFKVDVQGNSKMFINAEGKVGLGTDYPYGRVHIQGTPLSLTSTLATGDIVIEDTDAGIQLFSEPAGVASGAIQLVQVDAGTLMDKWSIVRETPSANFGGNGLRITHGSDNNVWNNPTRFRIDADGDVGIGAVNPQDHRLYVKSSAVTYSTVFFKNTNSAGIAAWCENESSQPPLIVLNRGTGDILTCHSGSGVEKVFSVKNDGEIECSVLRLTGGSDIAEPFEFTDNQDIPKGAVVVIDDKNPGKLMLSSAAYDTRVAGIVSGAGGVNPGIMLTQEEQFAGGQHIAISGRVYCQVDASYGAIRPGDLLTTSPTPGHAMKASDRQQAYGAVIGKAMTGLDNGQGMVLVLVSLQ